MKKACLARAYRRERKTYCKRATEDQNPGEPLGAVSVIMREMENLCVRDTGKEMWRGKKQKMRDGVSPSRKGHRVYGWYDTAKGREESNRIKGC